MGDRHIDMQVRHQEGQKAPLNTLPLEAAFDVLQGGGDGPVEHLDTQHVPGESLQGDAFQSEGLPGSCAGRGVYLWMEKSFNFIRGDNVSVT